MPRVGAGGQFRTSMAYLAGFELQCYPVKVCHENSEGRSDICEATVDSSMPSCIELSLVLM